MTSNVTPRRPANGKQVRADRTRAMVIDETVRCVLEEGFGAASAKHITERAGVTWGVIQYHFGDRDGLLMAVVDCGFSELLAKLREVEPILSSQIGTCQDRAPRQHGGRGLPEPDIDCGTGDSDRHAGQPSGCRPTPSVGSVHDSHRSRSVCRRGTRTRARRCGRQSRVDHVDGRHGCHDGGAGPRRRQP